MSSKDPGRETRPARSDRGGEDGGASPHTLPAAGDKHGWRVRFRARRAAAAQEDLRAESESLAATWRTEILTTLPRGATVCAYVPTETEPGGVRMLDDALAAGLRVLVPVTGAPGPLSWAQYTGSGSLRPARYGLLEPPGPVLAPSAIAGATLILVPAVAVDLRGVRLGRGGGYYDRTLPLAAPGAAMVCVVGDGELVDELPEDPHDVRVGTVLTPRRGVVRIDRH
ncbi:5-formyltetrahydrofolate cyclo-ligase [Tomitella fengzijianii]|uniref:5-formyltetrahydrofolate cyclo-ligase n=1 Tax=Tomitella fengzijianii TaxID=2597660 RepID=A0A516X1S5_9ACTN|nr:5-formyltetrahydrofolate cyclo-ligase [Tomitella fengzijianii]QDQ97036.1 5-formyltetrahydrofolate cyclo-ligase [Tomitella fengzijianii]